MERNKTADESPVLTTGTTVSDQPSWFSSLYAQLRESYAAYRNPRPSLQITSKPVPEASQLLIAQPTALRSVVASVRSIIEDWRNPRSYAVDPGEVKAIWGKKRYKAQVWSFAGYAALIAAVYAMPPIVTGAENGTVIEIATNPPTKALTPFFPAPPIPKPQPPDVPKDDKSSTVEGGGSPRVRPPEVAPPSKPSDNAGGGGGGGRQESRPATGGELLPFAPIQLTTPMPVPLNPHPAIAVPPTLVASDAAPINLSLPTPVRIGDLGDATAPPSSGTGKGGGIGNEGNGRGIGDGRGAGAGPGCCAAIGGGRGNSIPGITGNVPGNGGNGGGNNVVRGNISEPQVIRQTKPPYSEDARKNKVQGTVSLEIVVQADGSVDKRRVKFISGPGYGLDESAIEDVKTWMFKPATQDGRPISRTIRIEVRFTLR